ncbi:MAG: DUF5317 family protein [Acidimicrobiales bacterium]
MVLTPLAIAIGLIIGFLRGGTLDAVFKNRVMAWPLLAAGIVLQTIGESFDVPGRPFVVTLGLLCLIGCAMRNIHIPGTAVAGIGVTLNMAVLVVNGHIPVSFDALTAFGNDVTINPAATGLWQIETDDTSLSFLGDIVPTPVLHTPISFGDLIMLAGLMVIAMNVVLKGQARGIDPDDLFADDRTASNPGAGLPGLGADAVIDVDDDIDLRDAVVVIGPTGSSPAAGVTDAAESVELIDPASSPAPEPDGAAAPAPDGAAISDALFASVPDFDDDPIDLDELGGRPEPESGPQ